MTRQGVEKPSATSHLSLRRTSTNPRGVLACSVKDSSTTSIICTREVPIFSTAMKHTSMVGALVCLVLANAETSAADTPNPTVTLASGIVIGTATAVHSAPSSTATVYNYLGIPFAAPPTGAARFAPPSTPAAWSDPLLATSFPSSCIQQFPCKIFIPCLLISSDLEADRLQIKAPSDSSNLVQRVFNNPSGAPPHESEDCLYLNVFTPTDASGSNLKTVLLWIYGVCFLWWVMVIEN